MRFRLLILALGLATFFLCVRYALVRLVSPPPAHPIFLQMAANGTQAAPTLEDFWHGRATFILDVADTGLPMGESDTIILTNGDWWSYVHASDRSAGVIDQCGNPAPFPGCTVIYKSQDNGRSFTLENPVCQFECRQCPCDADKDHTPQQQYPRVHYDGDTLWLVYEYLGGSMLRRSTDGLVWSRPGRVAYSGLWSDAEGCDPWEHINDHPFAIFNTAQCLAGGPPGIFVEGNLIYIFVGMGQNPGHVGCFVGYKNQPTRFYQPCQHNPLLTGSPTYGSPEEQGTAANPYWDFRMTSSVEILPVGDEYYMLYEGIRGPGPNDPGDTQFALGMARTTATQLDGPWEPYPHNPLFLDLPGNIGLGHADLIVDANTGQTYLYTSLDGDKRSRLRLVWSE